MSLKRPVEMLRSLLLPQDQALAKRRLRPQFAKARHASAAWRLLFSKAKYSNFLEKISPQHPAKAALLRSAEVKPWWQACRLHFSKNLSSQSGRLLLQHVARIFCVTNGQILRSTRVNGRK